MATTHYLIQNFCRNISTHRHFVTQVKKANIFIAQIANIAPDKKTSSDKKLTTSHLLNQYIFVHTCDTFSDNFTKIPQIKPIETKDCANFSNHQHQLLILNLFKEQRKERTTAIKSN